MTGEWQQTMTKYLFYAVKLQKMRHHSTPSQSASKLSKWGNCLAFEENGLCVDVLVWVCIPLYICVCAFVSGRMDPVPFISLGWTRAVREAWKEMSCEVAIDPGLHQVSWKTARLLATVCATQWMPLIYTEVVNPGQDIYHLACALHRTKGGRGERKVKLAKNQTSTSEFHKLTEQFKGENENY